MKQEVKSIIKMLAFVMALLILIVSLPISAFASVVVDEAEGTSIDNISENADGESELIAKDIIVLEEDNTLREKNVKHFKLSDGTTKAVVYPQAVHYKDSNGKWIDIDNALTLNGSEYSSNNKTQIKFGNKSGSSGLVSIKDGEYKIDFTPLNTNKVAVIIENPQENNSRKFEDVSKLNNLVSKAIYKNIYDGIDIEYILVGNNIKENIIVREKQDSYKFSFELELKKLSAELVDNVIILSDYDTKEKVYEIPAPYMFDNSNEFSENVEYSLTQNSKWKYTFTVTADAEWINADDRAFPVTIDPTLGVNESDIIDYTNSMPVNDPILRVGNGNKAYVLINELPTLPNDSYVISAKLALYVKTIGDNYIGVYDNDGTTVADYNQIVPDKGEYIWEISRFLCNWYEYGSSSRMLRLESMSGTGTTEFYAMENSTGGHPIITIAYRDAKGLEPYWSYTSQSAGIAGEGNVNLKTGNLIFSIPTLTSTDSLFGFTPTLIYNSALAGLDYINANAQVAYRGAYVAKGFKFNGHETVMRCYYNGIDGENAFYYVWADTDGTEHYFYEKEGSSVYEDEDGLGCKLEIVSDTELKITDANFNTRTFTHLTGPMLENVTKAWYLTSLTDKNGNMLSFTFTQSGKNPIAVNVTPKYGNPIDMLTIGYSTDHRINLVWNKASGKACLLRHSNEPTGELNATGGAYLREMLILQCDSTVTEEILQAFVGDFDNEASGITVEAVTKYEYDSNGQLTKAIDARSDYCIEYTLNYFTGKVQEIHEYGKNQTQGQGVSFVYYRSYTEVIVAGKDDVLGTSDDLINVYCFDNAGRTVSTYTTNSTRTEIYGAVTGEYSEEEKSKNSISMSTVINGNSANYLLNGNFEASDTSVPNWTRIGSTSLSGGNSGIAWDNAKLYMYATPSGTTSISQTVKLSKGTYTMSLDINAHSSSNLQIYLKAISSNNTFVEEIPVNEVYASGSGGFASFTFEVSEATATNYTVGVYLVANSSATNTDSISVDNIMLAKTTGVSLYNNVNYADLENYTTGSELGKWNLTTGAAISNLAYTTIGNSIAITGSISEERSATQTIYIALQSAIDRFTNDMTYGSGATSEEVIFTISGFGKSLNAMNTEKSQFAIFLDIIYRNLNDIDNTDFITGQACAKFQSESGGWQFASDTFVLPENSMIKEIKVRCEYSNNINVAYFDNITLTCDKNGDTTRYIYNEDNGKLEAELKGITSGIYYNYDDKGNVSDVIGTRSRVSYTYDENHNLVQTRNYYHSQHPTGEWNIEDLIDYCNQNQVLKSTSMLIYNTYGLVADETTYDATNNQYIQTTYVYETLLSSKIFGAIKRTTDSFGKTTKYFYDSNNGQLIYVMNSDNTGYYYTYDNIGNLILVQPATVSYIETEPVTDSSNVQFVYTEDNQLESIIANGTTYVVSYDEFGNQNSVSIGDSQIVSYEINAYNGKTSRVVYANGTIVEYIYDHLSRVTEIKYTNGAEITSYSYEYDSNGNLCKYIDGENGITTIYKYDASGRLVKMIEYDTEEMKNNFGVSYHYDEESRLNNMYYYKDYLYGPTSYANVDVYYNLAYNTDNSLKYVDVKVGGSREYKINYNYDDFSRYASKVVNFGNTNYTTSYEYLSYENATSGLVSQYTIGVGDNNQIFNYKYDSALENITEIKDGNGNLLYRYTYDSLDRLIREDNSVVGETCVYEYDNNGNILSESSYAYTLGSLSDATLRFTYTYTYGNSQYKDQLTSYCGSAITYDAMGNPEIYYNGMEFEWENANNLVSVSDWGKTYTYTYNDSGIRTSKTVNGVTHTYHLDGTKILSESYGDTLILYIYDELNSIIGMAYRTSSYEEGVFDYYLFTKNLQGDIVGIYDTDGNCVASYTYNAWGQCNTTNHTNARIGNINPFRYRGYYYDSETYLYYLNARYYDPQIKRFINADTLDNLGANGDLNAFNLYAYCSNNPVMYVDPTGEIAWWVIAIVVVVVIAIDHALAKYAPSGLAVYDDKGNDVFHEKFLYANGSGAKCDENGATLVDLEMGVYDGTTEKEYMELSMTNLATVEAKAAIDWSGIPSVEAGGVASVYKIHYKREISLGSKKVIVSGTLYFGAIGAGVEWDIEEGKFKIMPPMNGFGADFEFDFDW